MKNDDIVQCQRCGENVFYENTQNTVKGRICKYCLEPIIYHNIKVKEEE